MPQGGQEYRFNIVGDEGTKTVNLPFDEFQKIKEVAGNEGYPLDDPEAWVGWVSRLPSGLIDHLYARPDNEEATDSEILPWVGAGTNYSWSEAIPSRPQQPPPPPATGPEHPEGLKLAGDVPHQFLKGFAQTAVPFREYWDPIELAEPLPIRGQAREAMGEKGTPRGELLRGMFQLGTGLPEPISDFLFEESIPRQVEGLARMTESPRSFFLSAPQAAVPLVGEWMTSGLERMVQNPFLYGEDGLSIDRETWQEIARGAGQTAGWIPGTTLKGLRAIPGLGPVARATVSAITAPMRWPTSKALGRYVGNKLATASDIVKLQKAIGVDFTIPSFGMMAMFSRGIAGKVFMTKGRFEKFFAGKWNEVSTKLDELVRDSAARIDGEYMNKFEYGQYFINALNRASELKQDTFETIYKTLERALKDTEGFTFRTPEAQKVAQEYTARYAAADLDPYAGFWTTADGKISTKTMVEKYANPSPYPTRHGAYGVEDQVTDLPAFARNPDGKFFRVKPGVGEEVVPAAKISPRQLDAESYSGPGITGRPKEEILAGLRPEQIEKTTRRAAGARPPGGSIPTGALAPGEAASLPTMVQNLRLIRRALREKNITNSEERSLLGNLVDALELDIANAMHSLDEAFPGTLSVANRALRGELSSEQMVLKEQMDSIRELWVAKYGEGSAEVLKFDEDVLARIAPYQKTEQVLGEFGTLPGEMSLADRFIGTTEAYAKFKSLEDGPIKQILNMAEKGNFEGLSLVFFGEGNAGMPLAHIMQLKEHLPVGEFERYGSRAVAGQLQKIMKTAEAKALPGGLGGAKPSEFGSLAMSEDDFLKNGLRIHGRELFEWFNQENVLRKLELIYEPQKLDRLKDVITVAHRVSQDVGNTQSGLFGGMVNIAILAPAMALAAPAAIPTATAGALGAIGGAEIFLRIATTQPGKQAIIGFLKAIETGNAQIVATAAEKMNASVQRERARIEQEESESGVVGSRSFDPSLDSERESRSRRGGIDPRMLATGLGARLPGTQNWSGRRQ